MCILDLEDDPLDTELVQANLAKGGITCEIVRVQTRGEFVAALKSGDFDLILSDYSLPAFDGLSALKLAKEIRPEVPFILVSGAIGEERAIEVLKSGATDYVLKQRLERLVPAVRRAVREAEDRTERRRAEDALGRSEERYRTLVEQIPAVTYIQEPVESSSPKAVTYMSPQYETILGYPAQSEMIKEEHWHKTLHPEDRERVLAEDARTDESGEPFDIEYRIIARNGRVVWVRDQATLVRNEDGRPLYWLGVQYDITEQKRVEEALRESEERFRATFEQAAVGMAHVGVDGRWLKVNQKLCDIVGYPHEELLGLSFQDITYPEDLETDLGYLRRLLTGEIGTYSTEKRYFRKDGLIVWINLTVSLVREVSGGPKYFISVIEDISQRKLAEEALRMSETRFRTVIEQSPLSIQILSPDGRTLQVNRSWEKLWGLTLEDVEGYNMLEDQQLVAKGIMPYIRKGFAGEPAAIPPIAYDPEQTIPGLSSHEEPKRWVRAFIYPVKDEAGNIREVVLMHEEVTERKQAEETLRESEERYRAVIEQSAEGLYLLDAATKRVMETNSSLQRMLGYSGEELRGMELYDLIELPREEVDATLRRTLEQGYRPVGERKYRRKDGTLVDVEIGASVIRYGGKEVVCAVMRDVTERKRAEAALREVREAERRRLARDLHDGVLQDLSYTTAAMGLIMLKAAGTSLEEELQRTIDALRRAAQGLRNAVNDLRLEEEQDRPFPELVKYLVQRNQTMVRGSEISLEVAEDFPLTPLGELGTQMLRIIREALTNARRHSGARNVIVSLRVEEGDMVAEVSDDGQGFGVGTTAGGVGLKSMRERAAAIGSKLQIESEVGEGTRMRLRVPIPQGE